MLYRSDLNAMSNGSALLHLGLCFGVFFIPDDAANRHELAKVALFVYAPLHWMWLRHRFLRHLEKAAAERVPIP